MRAAMKATGVRLLGGMKERVAEMAAPREEREERKGVERRCAVVLGTT